MSAISAKAGGIRAGSAPVALRQATHNPPVVGSSPTRPTSYFIAAAHDGKRGRHLIRCRAHVHLDTDVQFGATRATTGDYLRHDEPHPTDFSVETPWCSLECTFTLEPGAARLPRPPIKY